LWREVWEPAVYPDAVISVLMKRIRYLNWVDMYIMKEIIFPLMVLPVRSMTVIYKHGKRPSAAILTV